ncbi:MAG: PIG-L family deacetylase [Pirellulaceae bacterium]|nr:PIG-L family deacetylase [Pirellulaceae bacterium]
MPSVLAVAAHPDDIEFVMAGTLLRLAKLGWQVHYLNIANGCIGSMVTSREETARIRLAEAIEAANLIPAKHYPPICDDMAIFYNAENFAKVAAVVRQAKPSIVLTHSPSDYMEDHEAACRLAVSATFAKGMPNYVSAPSLPPTEGEVAVYHASPHGNCTPLREPIEPHLFVDTTDMLNEKQALLACHRSQQGWLDSTQKMSSYLQTMVDMDRQRGILSGQFEYAEAYRQRLHFGFSSEGFDPLGQALGKHASRPKS